MNKSKCPRPSQPDTFGLFGHYMVDAAQRTVLFWDVMRQRGDQCREHLAKTVIHVRSPCLASLPGVMSRGCRFGKGHD
jgi:hypothetical protein